MRHITNAVPYRVRFSLWKAAAPKLETTLCALLGILGVFCLPAWGQRYVLGQGDAMPPRSNGPGCARWISNS